MLRELQKNAAAHCFSYDHNLSEKESDIVRSMREAFRPSELLAGGHSPELLLSVFSVYLIHLRDRILASGVDKPVIVDSYYYKLLAKCILHGFINDQIFRLWRSLPAPEFVIYLDIDPETAWERSDEGRKLNRLEYYGREPNRAGFERFQADMRALMLRKTNDIRTECIRVQRGCEPTVNAIRTLMAEPAFA
ncbi:hypothetical protein GJW-30_1_02646 [Variibacter gotjawalensis]|uniref:Uncharacterized protein n=2 Tax=Variibacter gotjawalensis TaxID=1333996 RepID=A0A0S3PVZ0_9BRAD|nr:thymidylate kinase [Variibacter gotjawalensis]BAT60111.1 hypothetical protein GJW-30_1_02646 [Variibacter gotjawalensis]